MLHWWCLQAEQNRLASGGSAREMRVISQREEDMRSKVEQYASAHSAMHQPWLQLTHLAQALRSISCPVVNALGCVCITYACCHFCYLAAHIPTLSQTGCICMVKASCQSCSFRCPGTLSDCTFVSCAASIGRMRPRSRSGCWSRGICLPEA